MKSDYLLNCVRIITLIFQLCWLILLIQRYRDIKNEYTNDGDVV